MILTCPECSTSYFVDDARIPAAGRTVKCANCGHRWTAHRESEPAAEEPPSAAGPDEASDITIAPPAAEAAPAPEDDLAISPRPNAARDAARARKRRESAREARSKAFVLAAAAALVIAVVAGALIFRGQVVRLWPQSSAAYASLGLPVNAGGLVIEEVRAEPTFQGGRPALSITGAIRNLRDTPMTTPAIRISLIGRTGKPLSAKILHPTDPKVPAGASRHFAVAIVDPPAGAHDLEISFDDKPGVRAAAAPLPPPAAPPAPVEAKPLPAGAPDAIAQHG